MKINIEQVNQRVLDISKKHGTTHIGSCISAIPVIAEIYETKRNDDIFILSAGHAFLAWACILEAIGKGNAEELFEKHGTHPNRSLEDGIEVSAGSLGHGIGIGLGMALTGKEVYCLVGDGELAEGSCWEALRVKNDKRIDNLHVFVNMNGVSALENVNQDLLELRLQQFCPDVQIRRTNFNNIDWLHGISSHYVKHP